MPDPLIVDANPVISAMLGGAAREVIFSGTFTLYSPQHTLFEVEKYIPAIAGKLDRRELDLLRKFELLPIIACQPSEYDSHLDEARRLISQRDPKDMQILSLTLKLGFPLWTEDRDFDGIEAISVAEPWTSFDARYPDRVRSDKGRSLPSTSYAHSLLEVLVAVPLASNYLLFISVDKLNEHVYTYRNWTVCVRTAAAARSPCAIPRKGSPDIIFPRISTANRRTTMSTDLVQANTSITATPVAEAPELPARRFAALDALLSGRTATDAAAAAGVSRTTLYNWLGKDYRFQAALNRGRRDLRQAVACRADQLASEAAECVVQAVRKGDVRAALEILKCANIFAASRIGSDDEAVLRHEDEKRQVDREAEIRPAAAATRSLSRRIIRTGYGI